MDPKERLETVAKAAMSALKTQTIENPEKPVLTKVTPEALEEGTSGWSVMSKKALEETTKKYGLPNEVIPSRAIWYNNGPWKRTIVYRDEIPHNFPQPHTDVIENVINYRVPEEKLAALAHFDGSLIIEKTAGEVSARCDMEAANILSFNVMHEIVTKNISAEEARKTFCDITSAFVLNRPAPFAEALQFEVPQGNTAEKDKTEIIPSMMKQAVEKVKDLKH